MAVFGDFCPKTPEMHFSQIPVFDKSNKFFIHRSIMFEAELHLFLVLNIKFDTSKLDKILLFQLWMKFYYRKKIQNTFWSCMQLQIQLSCISQCVNKCPKLNSEQSLLEKKVERPKCEKNCQIFSSIKTCNFIH